MYLHLNQNSVRPPQTPTHVNEGEWIADSDDTGSGSSGPHLHLQIVVNSLANRNIDNLDSANKSRNPEIWLNPYNNITGSVIGKVTNTNGDPVPGISVYGLGKDPSWGYSFNETYTTTATLPPDDILMENWATTDVTPGYYHITLNNGSDMGWHTVEAGQVTYVGLYPVWLPNIYGSYNNFTSQIAAVNNSSSYTAKIYLTFFNIDGSVNSQFNYQASPKARAVFTTPMSNFYGSASLVSSEDLSVAVFNYNSTLTELNSYSGVTPKNGSGFPGWEIADKTLYAPSIKRNYYGRSSTINVFNSGLAPTTIHVDYYESGGYSRNGGDYVVQPYAWATIFPSGIGAGGCGIDNTICSAVITANPPLPQALVVREYSATSSLETSTHNTFNAGATTIYFPNVKYNYYNMTSGLVIQNIGNAVSHIELSIYNTDGSENNCHYTFLYVQPYASVVTPEFTCLGNNFVGTARATASQPLAGVGYERSNSGQSRKKTYSAVISSSLHALGPIVFGDSTTMWSGIPVNCISNYQGGVI